MPTIRVTLDRIEGQTAILIADQVETAITLSAKLLPAATKVGDVFYMHLSKDANAAALNKQEAKNLLNEILKGESTN